MIEEPVNAPADIAGRGGEARKVTAVRILVAGAVGLLLYFAHVAFVPLALAGLFALVLSGPVEMLHGLRVPRSASAVLLMLILLGMVAGVFDVLYEPAQHWFAEAPHTVKVIERKIRPLAQFMNRVDALRNSAGNMGAAPRPQTQAPAPANPPEETAPFLLLDATRGVLLSTLTLIILTLFLLAGGPPMLARMTSALVSDIESAHVLSVIEHVRREVGRFYVTTSLINMGLALATAFLMMLCGMPNPFLWGTIAGLLNFIPYAGPAASLILLSLVALVSFDRLAPVIYVAGSFLGLTIIEGQLIQPLLVGRRLQLNPMLVFLSLWFGGLFWGVAGIILATPALVALKVIAKRSAGGKPLADFLSPG
ncbi:MAG TPA: AI-2E family transporter [Steroidobacteraceae bacterium]|nr:AI-2E family transporter [Steroidobacteraceae bacterium]